MTYIFDLPWHCIGEIIPKCAYILTIANLLQEIAKSMNIALQIQLLMNIEQFVSLFCHICMNIYYWK